MKESALPSDAVIASLCNGLYDYPGAAPIDWDHCEQPDEDNGICWGLKRLAAIDVVVLRGSTTPQDWVRDFEAVADPFTHFALGPVHPGFLAGMESAYRAMKPHLRADVMICGHSLGAARAAVLTGLMVHDGRAPRARVVFGEPRPGLCAACQTDRVRAGALLSQRQWHSLRSHHRSAHCDGPGELRPSLSVDICLRRAGTGLDETMGRLRLARHAALSRCR